MPAAAYRHILFGLVVAVPVALPVAVVPLGARRKACFLRLGENAPTGPARDRYVILKSPPRRAGRPSSS